jgi:transposase
MTKDTMPPNTPTRPVKFIGLDVHKDSIAVALAEDGKPDAMSIGSFPNDEKRLRQVLRKIGRREELRVCYEAGPCGYVIHRFLERLKIDCVVVAPSLIPRKPGNRVKTDRRDARKLAVLLRNGMLTPTWVPDREHEALRDLVRAREDAVKDGTRARQRLGKFLLRLGVKAPGGVNAWTAAHTLWLNHLQMDRRAQQIVLEEYRQAIVETKARVARYESEIEACVTTGEHAAVVAALQAMRGVALVTAASIVAELGDVRRFRTPRQLMAYAGVVPSEYSSGARTLRGAVTKTGNSHLRTTALEAAWHYRHKPVVSGALAKRQEDAPAAACTIAWAAQQRLHRRYFRLIERGKAPQKAIVAVSRELLGFIWAVAMVAGEPAQHRAKRAAAA